MRFNTALSTIAFAPAANAFRAGSTVTNPTGITSTSLQARRLMVPMLRRSRPSMFFPDVDRMFREMDEMMEQDVDDSDLDAVLSALYSEQEDMDEEDCTEV